jgi:MFS family permease
MSGVVVTADAIEDIYTQSNSHISIAYNAPSKIHKVNFISNNIFHLFSKNLWKTTLVFMLIWFTLSFGSYGISSWISVLFDELEINNVYGSTFLFALANLPGNAFSIMYIDVIGRHRLLQYGMCLAALSALGFAFGTASMALVVLCSCLFNAFSVVGWNSLDCM